jgi:hypothetical protein
VVDCIDNLNTKADLIAHCINLKIPVISSGGAGMKSDFTRFQCNSLSKSTVDPLARALRRELKKRKVKYDSVRMVYSAEKTDVKLLPLNKSQEDDLDEAQILKGFRIRIVPVLGCSPALFGISIAALILTELGEKPIKPFVLTDIQYNNYTKIYDRFYQSDTNRKKYWKIKEKDAELGQLDEIYDIPDFVFFLKDVFKWHCVGCGKRTVTAADVFLFDEERKLDDFNVVFLCRKCGKEFKKNDNKGIKEALLPKMEVIWGKMAELRNGFDPMINRHK